MPRRRQQVFVFAWALAILMNNFKQAPGLSDTVLEDIFTFVTFMMAVSLLFQPANTKLFVAFAALSVVQWIGFLPRMPNHWMIIGLVNAAILIVWLFNQKASRGNQSYWFAKAEPLLRLAFVTCYGAAALVKWNSDFIYDLSVSCAIEMADNELSWLGLNIDFSQLNWFPWLIAATETVIFLFLLFGKLRSYGVIIASLFHLSLSLTPLSQGLGFTYTLWPLLLLFLSDKSIEEIVRLGSSTRTKLTKYIDVGVIRFIVTIFWGYIFFKYLIYPVRNDFDDLFIWLFRIFIGLFIGLGLAYAAWVGRNESLKTKPLRISGFAQFMVYSLVLFNVLTPYLGLKTASTMTMYSNIKVEGGSTNHFFFPVIPAFGYLNDLIKIRDTNWEGLSNVLDNDRSYTWLEFRRMMAKNPDASISYIRNGENFSYNSAKENPELVAIDPIAHKLLSHRPISAKNKCLW